MNYRKALAMCAAVLVGATAIGATAAPRDKLQLSPEMLGAAINGMTSHG